MKHGEMMALSNRGGTRTPLERASRVALVAPGGGQLLGRRRLGVGARD